VCDFSSVEVSGRRVAAPDGGGASEAAALGSIAGGSFMRRSCCWHGLGGNIVSLVR
jgi:hypothetical protein